jgi:hypothetical protein
MYVIHYLHKENKIKVINDIFRLKLLDLSMVMKSKFLKDEEANVLRLGDICCNSLK